MIDRLSWALVDLALHFPMREGRQNQIYMYELRRRGLAFQTDYGEWVPTLSGVEFAQRINDKVRKEQELR